MANSAPSLASLAGSQTYAENTVNATPQLIDADVTFSDAESNFNGGRVTVSGLLAEDRIAVRNEGTGASQIGVSGPNILYGNVVIATFTGGSGGTFTATLNAFANSAAVDALIQNLTYGDVSDTPTAARTLTINVFDAAGLDIEAAPSVTQLTGVANLFSTFTTTQSYILPTGIDFDNDGDTDLAVGTDDGTLLAFRNNGNGSFTQLTGSGVNPFFGVDVGGFSSPASGDVDNDGYLDLVVGADTHTLAYLHNNHNGTFTQLTAAANPFTGLNFNTISQPSSGDFDNDGDSDFIVTEATTTVHSFRNNGNNTFTELTGAANPFAAFAGQSTGSTFVDFDFDGDSDVLMGRANGTLIYGRNNGNGTFTQLTGVSNPFNGIDTGSYSSPVFIDIDGDSDLDMISGSSTRVMTTWRNNAVHGKSIIVNVTAEAENSAPTVGANLGLTLDEGAGGTITTARLDFNDAEQADSAITYTVTSAATNGTLRKNGVALNVNDSFTQADINGNLITYIHNGGETTSGSFGFSVSDGTAIVSSQSFAFTINPQNDAAALSADVRNLTETDAAADISSSGTLTISDADSAATFVAQGGTTGTYGTFAIDSAGAWTYTASSAHDEFVGGTVYTDTFVVASADGTTTSVTINLTGTNDALVVNHNIALTLAEGASATITPTQLDFDDAEQADNLIVYVVTSAATNGSLRLDANPLTVSDTFTQGDLANNRLTYIHGGSETTGDSFGFSVSDGIATVTGQSFAFIVTAENDAAILSADTANLSETNAAADLGASGTLSIVDVDSPATFVAQSDTAGTYGSFAIDAAGAWTYAASSAHDEFADGVVYTDTFPVASADGTTTSVTIIITGTNDAAVVTGTTTGSVIEAGGVANGATGTPSATGDLDATDVDNTADAWQPAAAGNATANGYGTYALSAAGEWTYSLDDDNAAVQALNGAATLTDTFSTLTADGTAQTVTITILAQDDAATAADDPGNTTDEDATVSIAVLANDSDPDGPVPNVAMVDGTAIAEGAPVTLASGAIVSLNTDGTLTYDPNRAFNHMVPASLGTGASNTQADDSFSYTINGGSVANVTVTVTGVTSAGDELRGDGGNNTITGTSGADFFRLTQGGSDNVSGLGASDVFYFGTQLDSGDMVDGGTGPDDQLVVQGNYLYSLGASNLNEIETLVLLSGQDARFGDTAGNFYSFILASVEANVSGTRQLTVDASTLTANEVVYFDGSAELGGGSFKFVTGAGSDTMIGGAGNDQFYGHGGGDSMTGNGGNDTFYLFALSDSESGTNDTINGFAAGDRIDLSAIDANSIAPGNNGFSFIGSAPFSGSTPGQLRVAGAGTNWTVEVDVDGDGNADMQIAVTTAVSGYLWSAVDFETFSDPIALDDPTNTVAENATVTIDVVANDTDEEFDAITVLEVDGNAIAIGETVGVGSGATVTRNADGTLTYDPNGAFNYLVPSSLVTGASNTQADDTFSYTIDGGSTATVTVTVTGVASAGDQLRGDGGDNTIDGTTGPDKFRLEQGGDDTVDGGDGNDSFFFGAAFGGADTVDGGDGTNDQIGLQGDYIDGNALVMTATTITNVEVIALLPGFDYDVTMVDANVPGTTQLTIFGGNLGPDDNLTFNGSAESTGSFKVYGGLGIDHITTGGGNDAIYFGPGKFDPTNDQVNGGTGANDQLALDGDYTATLTGTAIQNIDVIALLKGIPGDFNDFNLTLDASLLGPGQAMTIWGVTLQTDLTVDGSAVAGDLTLYGGAFSDRLSGGSGNDWFWGGADADFLTGNSGADTFVYDSVLQSSATGFDTLIDFDDSVDKIDLPNSVSISGFAGSTAGLADAANLSADLQAANGAGILGLGQAVVFTANDGDLIGRSFLLIDANGTAGYQATGDFLIELVNPTTAIDQVGMFI